VKKALCLAAVAILVLLGAYYSQGTAQGPAVAQPAGGPRLALIDVSRIFKQNARFEGMMNDMRNDVKAAEDRVKAEREAINKLGENLQNYRKGTQDYKSLEEELAKRQADLAVAVEMQKREFLQREARIYYNVYQEIWQHTDYFCRQHNIDMVLRFNGEAVDPDRPDSVLTHINKPVVWYDRGLDITEAILAEMNRTAINPRAADQRNAPQQPQRPTAPFSNPNPYNTNPKR
jgi:Skp family chaperone for outer membrane proteins